MDSRKEPRSKKRLTVRFGADGKQHMGYTENISPEGMFIQTGSVYRPGTRLQVEVTGNGETVSLEVQVRWAKRIPPQLLRKVKAGMGVKIVRIIAGEELFRSWLPAVAE